MAPGNPLKAFLATARSTLQAPASQRPSPLTFVVGNESADVDSLCSAVVYAYVRSQAPPRTLHIPLCNLPRADLGLRTEMTAVLQCAGLGPDDLLTLSDLPSSFPSPSASAAPESYELKPADTRWVLVDHNDLTGSLERNGFAAEVVGCVDHHVDENRVRADATPRVIEPCGSCMSLVVDQCRAVWDELTVRDPSADAHLAKLGLAAILLDTVNLSVKEKVKEKDVSAVGYLEARIQRQSRDFNTTAFFDHIWAVKEDISTLSFRDILRKDYKEWHDGAMTLGVSCVVQNLTYLVHRADDSPRAFLAHLDEWSSERRLDIAAVMTTSNPDGEFQRHLLVWGRSPRGAAAVAKFVPLAREKLRLEAWSDAELDQVDRAGTLRFAWRQHELAASRKQVAPLLREAMRSAREGASE
ncbi:hypothetical protein DCS_02487 [Drechmeria coniospora]|uniref:DHHA2 domain-containing protein n=1 Tax=Drechmeria coniospora TaxID=98403 RepID=A0A151GW54_DRECN|nr:hypothetical protein DCS_02487 [Drechmeria coniospora]KYK61345.1 hypothetical protein DCS_02487 [Drechmeria coniospora]ODA81107.1 hypothetical protein RJ55_04070 [Drechmeria coniospora]